MRARIRTFHAFVGHVYISVCNWKARYKLYTIGYALCLGCASFE